MERSKAQANKARSKRSVKAALGLRGDYCLISPARNEADYISNTLDFVLAQTVLPKRWIIIDDGSTDDTPQILAELCGEA